MNKILQKEAELEDRAERIQLKMTRQDKQTDIYYLKLITLDSFRKLKYRCLLFEIQQWSTTDRCRNREILCFASNTVS